MLRSSDYSRRFLRFLLYNAVYKLTRREKRQEYEQASLFKRSYRHCLELCYFLDETVQVPLGAECGSAQD